jgi:hypothetical protein
MYVVVKSNYKHADFDFKVYTTDAEMRSACFEEFSNFSNCIPLDEFQELWKDKPLSALIERMIEYGNWFVETENGWGWRKVIVGDNLTTLGGYKSSTPPTIPDADDIKDKVCELCDDEHGTVQLPDFSRAYHTREHTAFVCTECVAEWHEQNPDPRLK